MFEIRKFSLNIIVNIFQGHSSRFTGGLDRKLNILLRPRIFQKSKSQAKFCQGKNPWKILPDCFISILPHCILRPCQDPDREIENSGKTFFKSRMQKFCYIQVIVFDLSFLPCEKRLFYFSRFFHGWGLAKFQSLTLGDS